MSDPTKIADHQHALSAYLDEMLLEKPVSQSLISSQLTPHSILAAKTEQELTQDDWRDSPFQALLFDLHGLHLAIPLHDLSGIINWPDKALTKMPGKANWHLGLYSQNHQHTQIVDSSHIILPASLQASGVQAKFIIVIDEGKWGLACDQVNEVVRLSADQVRWRQQPGKRPWLAGMVVEKMVSIIDIKQLVKLLES